MKITSSLIRLLALCGLALLVVYLSLTNHVSTPLPFKTLTPQGFAGLIAWLFAVALFVERANEVVVMFFRDQKADLLDEAEARGTSLAQASAATALALAGNTAATPAERTTAAQVAAAADQQAAIARQQTLLYRADTKEIALLVGFFFGTLVSIAGIRALQGLLADNVTMSNLFTLADIIVTSAMLAGGSEGIHRIANVFTSFMDSLSTQIDQKSKSQSSSGKL
jgi:hypothetical protein